MKTWTWYRASLLLLSVPLLAACTDDSALPQAPGAAVAANPTAGAVKSAPIQVSGSAVHYFSTAAVHAQEPTGNGMIQRSTDMIRLTGDVNGYVLYHPTSVFDFTAGTLVNTGTQIFSGTIAGSDPIILHDDSFRFDVDLTTGATTGEVHLGRSGDAPAKGGWYECQLTVVGTGVTTEGDNLSDYTGTCTLFGNRN
jgi:hypothetical protein